MEVASLIGVCNILYIINHPIYTTFVPFRLLPSATHTKQFLCYHNYLGRLLVFMNQRCKSSTEHFLLNCQGRSRLLYPWAPSQRGLYWPFFWLGSNQFCRFSLWGGMCTRFGKQWCWGRYWSCGVIPSDTSGATGISQDTISGWNGLTALGGASALSVGSSEVHHELWTGDTDDLGKTQIEVISLPALTKTLTLFHNMKK